MSITLQLVESADKIEGDILSALADQFNSILKSKKDILLQGVKSSIPPWMFAQPEIQSLLSSDPSSLVGQFGITYSPTSIVNAIIFSVINSTTISIVPYNNKLKGGGLAINVQPDNFSNLLSLFQGHSVYRGGDLHWLEWMLMRGDETIIVGYEYNPQTGLGRSGLGNMTRGGTFRVPPQYSGTVDNNFITRALIGPRQNDDITKLIKKVLGV